MNPLRVVGIIPARFGSSRFPGKPLAPILGKPMIQRVYERCLASDRLDAVYVATDDTRIFEAVEGFGGQALMTSPDHENGTERLAEAAASIECHVVVNIQGDQPFIDAMMIPEVVEPLLDDPELEVCTLMTPIERENDLEDIGVVKVVVTLAGDAMYFSRSLIPHPHKPVAHRVYEHVGLYAYRKEALQRLVALPSTVLEQVESLEQLRWLEHGVRVRVVETACADQSFSGFSIDTPDDLRRGEAMLRAHGMD